MARLCPLFSGSGGNSFYIGGRESGILIDVGRSAKQMTAMLDGCGIPVSAVKGIFVTHEHADHVKGLRVFAGKHRIPVFASPGTMAALEEQGCLEGGFEAKVIGAGQTECAGMGVTPFCTSHDCAESVGYRVTTSDGRTAAFCTDLGYVSDMVLDGLMGSDLVVLESNHDEGMLKNGPYPYPLKKRILSQVGHLSNLDCAAVLPALARSGSTRFMLAHLSRENNTPELAYQTALCSLTMAGMKQGMDFELSVAPVENGAGKSLLF